MLFLSFYYVLNIMLCAVTSENGRKIYSHGEGGKHISDSLRRKNKKLQEVRKEKHAGL